MGKQMITHGKKIYIAGPMRGYPQFNFPAFFAAQKRLEKKGWVVFNPAHKDEEKYGADHWKHNLEGSIPIAEESVGFSLRDALALDLSWICREADAIYMLEGWEFSNGAAAEWQTAKALDLEIHYE